jgi:hypothetical protein
MTTYSGQRTDIHKVDFQQCTIPRQSYMTPRVAPMYEIMNQMF